MQYLYSPSEKGASPTIRFRFLLLGLVLLCFSSRPALAQTSHPCYTDELHLRNLQANPDLPAAIQAREQLLQQLRQNSMGNNTAIGEREFGENTPYVIPVAVHIINHPVGGSLGVTQAQVNNALEALNRDFQNVNAQAPAVTSNIAFCLATENGNPIITYTNNANTDLNADDLAAVGVIRAIERRPVDRFLNIWVVNSISATINGQAVQVAGISVPPSWLPYFGGNEQDGIIIDAEYFGDANLPCTGCTPGVINPLSHGRTLVHEAGHYLNLYHTFTGGCSGDGDYVSDTPPTQQPGTVNCANSLCQPRACCNDANGNPVQAQVQNHMDYSPESCKNTFTFEQRERMLTSIELFRPTLVSAQNLAAAQVACSSGLTVAVPSAAPGQICAGQSVNFTAVPSNIAGATYSWSFGNGQTHNGAAIAHTYTQPGVYNATLTVTPASGTPFSSSVNIYVLTCNPIGSDKGTWHFGNDAGISFASGVATAVAGNPAKTSEGIVSVSDNNGNLLFYTGKVLTSTPLEEYVQMSVFTNAHQPLQPVLRAGHSSTQQTLAVPDPANANRYYLFQAPSLESVDVPQHGGGGFLYSIIDMASGTPVINNPNSAMPVAPGAMVTADGTMRIDEQLTAIQHCNGTDYWIIVKNVYTQTDRLLYVYRLTPTGITYHGSRNLQAFYNQYNIHKNFSGYAKFSNGGDRLAICEAYDVLLLDFDRGTGNFSANDPVLIQTDQSFTPSSAAYPYGVAFSPLDSVLYVSNTFQIFQYNLKASNPGATGVMLVGSRIPSYDWGALQLGPDGRIYAAIDARTSIACINFPDLLNTPASPNACGFNFAAVPLSVNTNSRKGLPNFIDAAPAASIPLSFGYTQTNCTTVNFTATPCRNTYSWNFGGSSTGQGRQVTHTFPGPGSYTVTLTTTGQAGMVSQVIVIDNPVSAIEGPLCISSGTVVDYSVYGGPQIGMLYDWAAVGGSVIPMGVNAQVAWGNTQPSSVTLTATSSITGCSSSSTLNYLNGNALEVSVPTQPLCFGQTTTLTATHNSPTSTLLTYSWAPATGLSCTGCPNPTLTAASVSTYTVWLTTADGCQASSTFNVAPGPECCVADYYISGGTQSLSLPYTSLSNSTIYIVGELIVDNSLTFTNCDLVMAPGAQITVVNGGVVTANGTTFRACTEMWRGFVLEQFGELRGTNLTIADAQYGIIAKNRSLTQINTGWFMGNYTGILVPPHPTGQLNSLTLLLSNCHFMSNGALSQGYPGQQPEPQSKGWAGMEINNLIYTANGHTFNGMCHGIITQHSNVRVENCSFTNILPDLGYGSLKYLPHMGSGIYVKPSLSAVNRVTQVGFGKNSTAYTFDNCNYAVYARSADVSSVQNNMRNMERGYWIGYGGVNVFRHIDVSNNKIDSRKTAIDLPFNDRAWSVLVADNHITFGYTTLQFEKGAFSAAINVQEGQGYNPKSIIRNNVIAFRPGANIANAGINMTAAADFLVEKNIVSMASNSSNHSGISTSGCVVTNHHGQKFELSCNQVTGSGNYTPGNEWQAAIYNNRVPGTSLGKLAFTCNDVTGTRNGLLFSGVGDLDVRGNKMIDHAFGLRLDGSANIGEQKHKGNRWMATAPAITGGQHAKNDNVFNTGASLFFVDPNLTNQFKPTFVSPSGWFLPQYLLQGEGTFSCGTTCLSGPVVLDPCCAERYLTPEEIDSLENGDYTDETRYMLQRELYAQIESNPQLLSDADMAAFYDYMQQQLAGQLHEIEKDRLSLFGLDSLVMARLEENKAQLELHMHQLDSLHMLLGSGGLSTADSVVTAAEIAGIMAAMNTLVDYNNTALTLAYDARVLTAENVRAVNASLGSSTRLIEQNEKAVNDIYLASIVKGLDPDSAQAQLLHAIAIQCPMAGGNAVFRARAMYSLLNDAITYNDPETCLQSGIVLRQQKKPVSQVRVYPNPAADRVTLEYKLADKATGTLVLYNTLGQEVARHSLPGGSGTYDFSTANYAQAMYYYKVYRNGTEIGSGKLTIIR